MAGAGKDLLKRLPESQRAVTHGQLWWHPETAGLEVDQQFAPALGALAHADLEAEQLLAAFRRGPDHDQHAFGGRLHPGLQVDPVGIR